MAEQKATNIVWHQQQISTADLEALHGHKGATLWFTGLSGSGKSTLANAVASKLHAKKVSTFVLDGDNIRHGLNKDLGFTAPERVENIRRIGEVAKLFTTAGVVNLTAFISPYKSDRDLARSLQPATFIEVYCEADLAVCESRDPKGMYKKARAGQIKHFTGIDDPYETPEKPELVAPTGTKSLEECADEVLAYLKSRGII
jgi:adenylylsulfate kinase